MAIYGIMDKIKSKVVATYVHTRMKSIRLKEDEVQFQLLASNGDHGLDQKAYSWNITTQQVEFDTEYVPFDPTSSYCKIYRYIQEPFNYNKRTPPIGHDYSRCLITTFYPKRYFNQGELYKVEHYSDEAQTDLIIKVDIVYERDAMGFATKRTTTREWYLEDGTAHDLKKITEKIYTQGTLAPIEEGVRRRGNIVKGIQMPILGMMIGTIPAKSGESEVDRQNRCIKLGRRFLAQYKESFTMFVEDSNRRITQEIEDNTDFWIDNVIDGNGTTIRNYMLSELNIGGLE